MQPVPLLGLGIQSGYPSVTAQERINCYLETQKDAEKTSIVAYGTPGLELFADLGETPIRGMITFGSFFYVVHRAVLYKINNAAVAVSLGEIGTTSGRVSMATNGFQIIIVDGTTTGYIYDIAEDATVTIADTTLSSATITMTIAAPCVVTWTAHPFANDEAVQFTTTGDLPTGITAGTTYYVKDQATNTFELSLTRGGGSITTTGSQSGTHTGKQIRTDVTWSDHGLLAGTGVSFTTSSSLPAPLVASTVYFVKTVVDANTFTIAATSGGDEINITSAGSGTHTGASSLAAIADTGYPGLTTVGFLDGYFIGNKPNSGRYYISDLLDGLAWDALDFATAESSPDDLVAVKTTHGQTVLFGKFTSEIVANTGAQDFPFGRSGIAIEWGLVSPFSIAEVDEYLGFLAKNKLGEVQVCLMRGHQVSVVSTSDLDRILNDYTTLTAATAYSYMLNGHAFYVLNVGDETWTYDLKSDVWSQLKSHSISRHRAEIGVSFLEKIMVSDYEDGKIYRMSDTQYTDNGDPILMIIRGRHLSNNREYLTIDRVEVDFEAGVGLQNGQGSDPQAMMRYSKDQGHTWSAERWRTMGKVGKYKSRAFWTRFGRSRDFVLEVSVSDPVKRCITGVYGDMS